MDDLPSTADTIAAHQAALSVASGVDALRVAWWQLGVINPTVATEAEIDTFEHSNGVKLPTSVRHYFATVNGTARGYVGEDDAFGMGFWHMSQVRRLTDEAPSLVSPEHPDMFVFADWMIWAWGIAFRLTEDPDLGAPVYWIAGADSYQLLAPSFEAFVVGYLNNPDPILGFGFV